MPFQPATIVLSCFAACAAVCVSVLSRGIITSKGGVDNQPNALTSSILEIFARQAFDWSSSTTPAPLSTTAVLAKAILAGGHALPAELDAVRLEAAQHSEHISQNDSRLLDLEIAQVRNIVSSSILAEVKQLCTSPRGCNPNEADPEFGTTPLHFAELWGSRDIAEYLESKGANPEAWDSAGRQPRNMTFAKFSYFSKISGRARLDAEASSEELCEFPEVVIPRSYQQNQNLDAWKAEVNDALTEVRRLSSEGEPVMVRNVLPWLETLIGDRSMSTNTDTDTDTDTDTAEECETTNFNEMNSKTLKYADAASFIQAWGHRPVDVGSVPYAKVFDLDNEHTTLLDYVRNFLSSEKRDGSGDSLGADVSSISPPKYVFQVDAEACAEGRQLLGIVVDRALPSSGEHPIICPPASGRRGLDSVHYYLGGAGTGAPFHIHSDALNLAVAGRKRWWIVTPRRAVWSRRHVSEYAEHGRGGPAGGTPLDRGLAAILDDPISEGEKGSPMECIQRAGDMVYVPADWGHAAMNLEENTFGYTLELVNRRDSLTSVLGQDCEA